MALVVVAGGSCVLAAVDDPDPEDVCSDDADSFVTTVWEPVIHGNCFFCHNVDGAANQSALLFSESPEPEAAEANFYAACVMGRTRQDGGSRLLLKATYTIDHGGGQRIVEGTDEYRAMAAFVGHVSSLEHCPCAP